MKNSVRCLKLMKMPVSIGTTCTSSSKTTAGRSSRYGSPARRTRAQLRAGCAATGVRGSATGLELLLRLVQLGGDALVGDGLAAGGIREQVLQRGADHRLELALRGDRGHRRGRGGQHALQGLDG